MKSRDIQLKYLVKFLQRKLELFFYGTKFNSGTSPQCTGTICRGEDFVRHRPVWVILLQKKGHQGRLLKGN